MSFRAGCATSEELTTDLSSRKDATRCRRAGGHRATDCIFQVSRHWETGGECFNSPMSAFRRTQARHRVSGCTSLVPLENPEVTEPRAWDWKDYPGRQRKNNSVHRLPQDATGLKIPVSKHRETDCSPRRKKMMTRFRTLRRGWKKTSRKPSEVTFDELHEQRSNEVYLRMRLHVGIIPNEGRIILRDGVQVSGEGLENDEWKSHLCLKSHREACSQPKCTSAQTQSSALFHVHWMQAVLLVFGK